MAKLSVLLNVRIFVYALKLHFTGPYALDGEGNVKFSKKIRFALYIFNAALVSLLLYFLVFVLRPKDAFSNAYTLLGFLRGVFQSVSASGVILWNVHFSERASRAIYKAAKLGARLDFTRKELKWITVAVVTQITILSLSLALSLYYMLVRWGLSTRTLIKLCNTYAEIGFFSAELAFVNLMVMLNRYANVVNGEIIRLLRIREKAFDSSFFRFPVKGERESKTEKINRIRVLYGKIYDLKELIHAAFSFPLLVTTATTFANTVFFVFVNTVQFKYGTEMTTRNYFFSFLYPTMVFAKLSVIVTVCSRFTGKVNAARTASAKLYEVAESECEKDTVTGLVQELKHMDPEITCYRFTVIDYELVTSIIGTIITYTVILLQTKFTEGESDPVEKLLFEF